MTRMIFHIHEDDIPANRAADEIHVLLYGRSPAFPGTGSAGRQLLDLSSRFGLVIRDEAFDFLSITIAVTVADTFVKRETADDGWGREFEIVLPLANPEAWQPDNTNRAAAVLWFRLPPTGASSRMSARPIPIAGGLAPRPPSSQAAAAVAAGLARARYS
jgi:hypothetical protein